MGLNRRDKEAILRRLRRDGRLLADHFGLEYRGIESERANVRNRYGACYSDGLIKIRLWNVRTNKPLKYSSLIDTLCHELAHLRHFDHGPQFKRLYLQILAWARAAGIYRPRQRGSAQETKPRLRIPERDGVAVFAGDERSGPRPWERFGLVLGEPPAAATRQLALPASVETSRPTSPPPARRPEVPASPTSKATAQLSLLLDAPAGPTSAPSPRRRPSRPIPLPTAAPKQLGLFGG